MLYHSEAFESLTDEPWDAARVRTAIRAIVADTDASLRGPKLLWRADAWDGWHARSPMKDLYVGAAGVFWALDELRRRDHAETKLDLADLALRSVELFRARPDYMKGMKLPRSCQVRGSRHCSRGRPASSSSRSASPPATSSPTICSAASARTWTTRRMR